MHVPPGCNRVTDRLSIWPMEPTFLLLTLPFLALATALGALIIAARTAAKNARALATTEARKILARIEELETVQVEQAADIKRIRSRYAMAAHRAGKADAEPDWRTDPDGWRAYWDKQIAKRKGVVQ